ncbi:prolyl-tRNA synthetase [Candidatus Kaiserbacteria bacterium CG_4_9_14_0_2_um_filter_41_32]|uniref:Proline--tRNA ligase n=1 Tax=Candidatus Kaiserbacteria bacterium CG_4_9_14_0_2_um_filter_41_32 TaxID=1974601 RepID=A0A2M8FEI6_9BACT|nr:MAG: prolyl-tRNA synthetase [Candidatus Kaiserbacteria bacterium CG_4_9_14_0_2_um_filter_41_32]
MRQSILFTKTRKEAPADEVSKNAQLLIQAGFIYKNMAGVYTFLPLGLRVIEKIKDIIRDEINAIGGQEMYMPSLQDSEIWRQTDRWSDEKVDVWFKTELKAGGEVGLAWTHEEVITDLMRQYVSSYKDLPLFAYHIQTKFRNEMRAKSGIMRTREFWMKDLYSFSATEEQHHKFYEECAQAYKRIFDRIGIGDKTYRTFASGGAFTKFSHEFQTLAEAGEDVVYVNEAKGIAVNEEVLAEADLSELGVTRDELEKRKSIEVGNIFSLGTKFSEALGLTFMDENGAPQPVIMGSYGIGPARAMGTVVDLLADEKGIVWPESIAPFLVHLVALNNDDEEIRDWADGIYDSLTESGVEVLYDDRDARAGEKFADSDLIGIPYRVIISRKTKAEGKFEVVTRATGDTKLVTEAELSTMFIK